LFLGSIHAKEEAANAGANATIAAMQQDAF